MHERTASFWWRLALPVRTGHPHNVGAVRACGVARSSAPLDRMQQPPGFPPAGGGGGYGPPGGGYGPPPGGGGYGPPPGGGPPGGGGYGPPPGAPPGGFGSYGPPGGPPGGGYGPPPGGAYGPPPQPPPKKGPNIAVIALIALVGVSVLGLGGCLTCLYLGGRAGDDAAETADNWITSERPFVKFIAPPGWDKSLKGDWGIFKAKDGQAVFAFTTFDQPGESTARLGRAAWALGVTDIAWGNPSMGTIGRDGFPARMGDGSCNFNGPGGYVWYATVNAGTSDQILLMYAISAGRDKAHMDAAGKAVRSLQRRP